MDSKFGLPFLGTIGPRAIVQKVVHSTSGVLVLTILKAGLK